MIQHQARTDVHVHSKHSDRPSEWLLRRIGAPESFTEPLEVYRRAKAAGMDFVTISDHDSIDGALEIAHLPGAFLSSEVTTYFPEDGCKIHLLVFGVDEAQHRMIDRCVRACTSSGTTCWQSASPTRWRTRSSASTIGSRRRTSRSCCCCSTASRRSTARATRAPATRRPGLPEPDARVDRPRGEAAPHRPGATSRGASPSPAAATTTRASTSATPSP